jgi:ribosomal protein S18 acetylase RimI-like enzyme
MYEIKICRSADDYTEAKKVTADYIKWLGIDLTFQNADEEFKDFNKMYGPPTGCYLLAIAGGKTAGGVGLREFTPDICEMKRLYVYQKHQGIGEALCIELFIQARNLGYTKMRLDTMARLEAANKLYDKLGFYEIPPYRYNPDETARFMEYDLQPARIH